MDVRATFTLYLEDDDDELFFDPDALEDEEDLLEEPWEEAPFEEELEEDLDNFLEEDLDEWEEDEDEELL